MKKWHQVRLEGHQVGHMNQLDTSLTFDQMHFTLFSVQESEVEGGSSGNQTQLQTWGCSENSSCQYSSHNMSCACSSIWMLDTDPHSIYCKTKAHLVSSGEFCKICWKGPSQRIEDWKGQQISFFLGGVNFTVCHTALKDTNNKANNIKDNPKEIAIKTLHI